MGIKAEQNWQATSHDALQRALKTVIRRRNPAGAPEFPWYRAKSSVAWFEFRYDLSSTDANGVAAKVYTYSSNGSPLPPPAVEKGISQAKRDLMGRRVQGGDGGNRTTVSSEQLDREAFWRWADMVTVEELVALGPTYVSEQHIIANHSDAGINTPATSGAQGDDGGGLLPDIVSGPPRADPSKIKKRQEALSEMECSPPLLRRASDADIDHARQVVDKALRRSAKLNSARLTSPSRNSHPATPDEDAVKSRAAQAPPPPPLLEITKRIADAAALVSEADAILSGRSSWLLVTILPTRSSATCTITEPRGMESPTTLRPLNRP